jgi:hypothetical protein
LRSTFDPAASRHKAPGHGIFATIYVALGGCGSSANPFFSSVYLISLDALHCRRTANAEDHSNNEPLKLTFKPHL